MGIEVIKLKKAIKSIRKWLFNLHLGTHIGAYIEDILIFCGLGFVVYATFLLSRVGGFYCLGVCLFGLGVYFTRNPTRKG